MLPLHPYVDSRRAAPAGQLAGVLVSTPRDGGKEVQTDMIRCCHCQRVWAWVVGSGRWRGRCGCCGGITCGPHCPVQGCVPALQLIENLEAGMTFEAACLYRSIKVAVPAAVPGAFSGIVLA